LSGQMRQRQVAAEAAGACPGKSARVIPRTFKWEKPECVDTKLNLENIPGARALGRR